MFKFNFSDDKEQAPTERTSLPLKETAPALNWLKSQEIEPNSENEILLKDIFQNCEEITLTLRDLTLKYFSTVDVLNVLRTSSDCEATKKLSVLRADESHSDLQAAVYEGGLKIWECTFDLINYITENIVGHFQFKNTQVLDLGCGAGLIGIICLLKGSSCTFQDYNAEILQYITIPNVRLNDETFLNKSKFYSGDWESFADIVNIKNEEDKFDYIFTSETIYNPDNYVKLHLVFERLLKKNGKIYLAAKSYYFGVGGGITLFEEFLKSKNLFNLLPCWNCSEGLKREIFQINFL